MDWETKDGASCAVGQYNRQYRVTAEGSRWRANVPANSRTFPTEAEAREWCEVLERDARRG